MHNPYSVKIELARGCTRRCPFCTLSTIDWKDDVWQFIKPELFEEIVKDLSTWTPKVRIEMDERGEPSFHPKLIELITIARKHLPKAQLGMISNGDMIDKKEETKYNQWINSIMDAGLNILVFDCYEKERLELMRKRIPQAIVYGKEASKNPWSYNNPNTTRDIYLLPGFLFNQVNTRKLRNQGGNLDVIKATQQGFFMHKSVAEMSDKMCVRPFRELVIHSDGTVPLCCDDWRQQGVLAKFPESGSLHSIWYGKKMNGFRKNLIDHDRTAQLPCSNCNTPTGFRAGLEVSWFRTGLENLKRKR